MMTAPSVSVLLHARDPTCPSSSTRNQAPQVRLPPVAPLPSSLSPGNYGSPGWEVRRCVARHSSWTRSDTPGGQDRNRNSLAGGDTSVNILASHLPGEQQLPSCPGPHGWWVSAGCYSGVMPADSERLAVVLAWWAITCISAHSALGSALASVGCSSVPAEARGCVAGLGGNGLTAGSWSCGAG